MADPVLRRTAFLRTATKASCDSKTCAQNAQKSRSKGLFVHNRAEGISPVTVKMLWDRASGRTYVLCL